MSKEVSSSTNHVQHVKGWIKSVRLLKNIAFIDLQDGTCTDALKVCIPIENSKETEYVRRLKTGQSVSITNAQCKMTPEREQSFELKISEPLKSISIIGNVTLDYPLQKKAHSLSFLRTQPTLKHRSSYLSSLMRFRSHLELSLFNFFQEHDFTKVSPPVLTSSDCEGAGELFKVQSSSRDNDSYFGKPTYLTVSTQLHLEIMAMALSRCYTLTPCFRAERSDTNRHLSEFWMLESEISFVDSVLELTRFVEEMLKNSIKSCYEQKNELLPIITPDNSLTREEILKRWESLLHKAWATISYTEAIGILKKQHAMVPFPNYEPKWGESLQTEHEKWLAGEHFESPVFVTDYPRDCKAFYMKANSEELPGNETVACFDLLVPEMGEIVGGSMREDNYDSLSREMARRKMNSSGELTWYLKLRSEGTIPHGGFGLGLERLASYLFGSHNIKDAIPFHRSASGSIEL